VYNDVKASRLSSLKNVEREGSFTNVMPSSIQPYKYISGSSTITVDNGSAIDRFVENASFLRCDNITLGYTFGKVKFVKSARVYGAVQNPFVITGYSGLDPEVKMSSGIDRDPGIDNNIYPRSLTAILGVSLQF
jgi:iron complex outermembrane receptor protein